MANTTISISARNAEKLDEISEKISEIIGTKLNRSQTLEYILNHFDPKSSANGPIVEN